MASRAISTPLTPRKRASLKDYFWRVANNYVFRRILKALLTIYIVITVTFFVIRLMPSNPVDIFIQEQMALYNSSYQEARDRAAALFAIDLKAPVTQQYLDYMGNLLRGDFGKSYRSQGANVADIIKQFLPWTLFCVGLSLFISFTLGVALLIDAVNQHGVHRGFTLPLSQPDNRNFEVSPALSMEVAMNRRVNLEQTTSIDMWLTLYEEDNFTLPSPLFLHSVR